MGDAARLTIIQKFGVSTKRTLPTAPPTGKRQGKGPSHSGATDQDTLLLRWNRPSGLETMEV